MWRAVHGAFAALGYTRAGKALMREALVAGQPGGRAGNRADLGAHPDGYRLAGGQRPARPDRHRVPG